MKKSTTAKISKVLKQSESKLLKKSNVVGVGIGKKIKGGKRTGRACLKVYVEKKVAKERLSKQDLVPPWIAEVETDVVEVGKIRPLASNRQRSRPARGGASIGHYKITAGTLGCLVKDKKTGKALILSNNHVLANSNEAQKGDSIIQPGAADGGKNPKDKIAELERWVKISFGNRANTVDAAVALPLNDKDVSPAISSIGIPKGTVKGTVGLVIQKTGRTTDHTLGEIQDIHATVRVDYDGKTALFRNQILTSAMSQGGDSGSLVLDQKRRAVGLLFAGSDLVTICNPIGDVCKLLDVQ
ncbi:MAG: hypothetical protein HY211_08740 [Candidatus Omnitrophica bacterium]|nr:hypothetical protein [Candidatus Omnitrophota bacterium]